MRLSQWWMLSITVVLGMAGQAQGAMIFGGSNLLTASDANQLESWLGQGPITLTNIYDYTYSSPTNIANDFHAAVDGMGPTFTVIRVGAIADYDYATGQYVFRDGANEIIGGYSPQSWNSASDYNYSVTDAERTAFLFNLTDLVKQNQNLIGEGDSVYPSGEFQTYNSPSDGPDFGGGYDVYVGGSQSGSPFDNYVNNFSYGGTTYTASILGGPNFWSYFSIKDIEVFAISPPSAAAETVTPEPASVALLCMGGGLLVAGRKLRSRKTTEAV